MRFNLHNIHRQSAQSNHFQNEDGLLRERLAQEYGQSYFEFLSDLRRTPPLKFWNRDYLRFYTNACKIALNLRREGRLYNKRERIVMRNTLNIKLGIYHLEYCNYENKRTNTP